MSALDGILDELAERLATRVSERLRLGEPNMIAQTASPLGARRHCAAVKRRLSRGEPGAAIVGRRHLLSPDALSQELERSSKGRDTRATVQPRSVRSELLAELRLVENGGRRG